MQPPDQAAKEGTTGLHELTKWLSEPPFSTLGAAEFRTRLEELSARLRENPVHKWAAALMEAHGDETGMMSQQVFVQMLQAYEPDLSDQQARHP